VAPHKPIDATIILQRLASASMQPLTPCWVLERTGSQMKEEELWLGTIRTSTAHHPRAPAVICPRLLGKAFRRSESPPTGDLEPRIIESPPPAQAPRSCWLSCSLAARTRDPQTSPGCPRRLLLRSLPRAALHSRQ